MEVQALIDIVTEGKVFEVTEATRQAVLRHFGLESDQWPLLHGRPAPATLKLITWLQCSSHIAALDRQIDSINKLPINYDASDLQEIRDHIAFTQRMVEQVSNDICIHASVKYPTQYHVPKKVKS